MSLEILLLIRELICMGDHFAAEQKPLWKTSCYWFYKIMLNLLVVHGKLHQSVFFFFWLELDTLSMREDVKDEGLRPSVNLWTKWQTGRYKPRTEAKLHFDYRCTEWFGKINFVWPWEEECCWALAIWSEATGTFSTSNLSRLGLNANLYLCCVGWCPFLLSFWQ